MKDRAYIHCMFRDFGDRVCARVSKVVWRRIEENTEHYCADHCLQLVDHGSWSEVGRALRRQAFQNEMQANKNEHLNHWSRLGMPIARFTLLADRSITWQTCIHYRSLKSLTCSPARPLSHNSSRSFRCEAECRWTDIRTGQSHANGEPDV